MDAILAHSTDSDNQSSHSSSSSEAGSPTGSSSSSSSSNESGPAAPVKSRVVWVGNVNPRVHHDELRDIFRVALGAVRPDIKVCHVHVQYQRKQRDFNSATIFLNRSVDIAQLQRALRTVARQPKMKVRKCKNNKRRLRLQQQRHNAVSARQAARAYVEYQSNPLPAEVGAGTPAFARFVRDLEQGTEGWPLLPLP